MKHVFTGTAWDACLLNSLITYCQQPEDSTIASIVKLSKEAFLF